MLSGDDGGSASGLFVSALGGGGGGGRASLAGSACAGCCSLFAAGVASRGAIGLRASASMWSGGSLGVPYRSGRTSCLRRGVVLKPASWGRNLRRAVRNEAVSTVWIGLNKMGYRKVRRGVDIVGYGGCWLVWLQVGVKC